MARRRAVVQFGLAVLWILAATWARRSPERRKWVLDRAAETTVGDSEADRHVRTVEREYVLAQAPVYFIASYYAAHGAVLAGEAHSLQLQVIDWRMPYMPTWFYMAGAMVMLLWVVVLCFVSLSRGFVARKVIRVLTLVPAAIIYGMFSVLVLFIAWGQSLAAMLDSDVPRWYVYLFSYGGLILVAALFVYSYYRLFTEARGSRGAGQRR